MLLDEAKSILKENNYELINEDSYEYSVWTKIFIWDLKKEDIEKTQFFNKLYKWSHTAEVIQKDRGCDIVVKRVLEIGLIDELLKIAKDEGIFKYLGLSQINMFK